MKNKKSLFILALILIFTLNSLTVFAETSSIVKFNTLSENSTEQPNNQNDNVVIDFLEIESFSNNIEIFGKLPVVNTSNQNLNDSLNEIIMADYENRLAEVKKINVSKFEFDFEVFESSETYSLVVKYEATNLATKSYINTYNISKDGEILNIYDVLGSSDENLLKSIIKSKITSDVNLNTDEFFFDTEQSFYFDGDVLNLVFNSGIFNSIHEGIYTLSIEYNDIQYMTITNGNYFVEEPFNVKMVDIAEICNYFGFDFVKNSDSEFLVFANGFESYIHLTENDNYIKNGNVYNLEAKPVLKNDTLYVPITYVSDILDLIYYNDDYQNITIALIR